jgi:RimJ/RimL family protein N-acetyltransferase
MSEASPEQPSPIRHTRIVQLKNGTPVLIRPIRHDDRERVIRAFHELEAESVYTRFFSPKRVLSEADLARIDASDFVNALVLLATIGQGDAETIIGAGSYSVVDQPGHPRTAELSFTIEEDYHGQGLATRLMAALTEIAREHGIRRFEAEVLAANSAMLGVFLRSGLPMRRRREGSVVFVEMDIPIQKSEGS